MGVEVLEDIQRRLRGVPRVQNFQPRQVGVVKGRDKLVLQGGVEHPVIVVFASLLLVLLEEAFILPGRCP